MTTTVNTVNIEYAAGQHGPIKVLRRFPATGNETEIVSLVNGETAENLAVWDDCELVIREADAPPAAEPSTEPSTEPMDAAAGAVLTGDGSG